MCFVGGDSWLGSFKVLGIFKKRRRERERWRVRENEETILEYVNIFSLLSIV